MPKNIVQYDLLISCPGDITNEIDIIEKVVSQFNEQFSDTLGISIRTRHWQKSAYAQSGGKPQALLNEQFVYDCDAAVAVFWTRFGTPTDKYGSGTEEEIETMLSSGKQVFMYFSNKKIDPSQMSADEYKKVQAFRDRYKDQGIYFVYSSDEEFEKLFFAHLSQHFLSEKRVAEVKNARHSELKVVGIDHDGHINDKAQIIDFVPDSEMSLNMYFMKMRTLFDEISAIKLDKRIELPTASTSLAMTFEKPVEIDDNQQRTIYSIAKLLDINITEDFFILGNLSKSIIPTGLYEGSSLTGTSEEKKKYHRIYDLLDIIDKASAWAPIERAFLGKKCLKLALQNCGTDIDEDIEISLRFPKESLLPMEEFPKLNNDEMGYLLNDCEMSVLFGIRSTSAYSNYDSSIVTTRPFSSPSAIPTIFPGYAPDYSDDFERELAEVFCYSCFDEKDEFIVKLKMDYIKHNTTIAFPSVIFIKEPFGSIPYSITSKFSPEITVGEILIANDISAGLPS